MGRFFRDRKMFFKNGRRFEVDESTKGVKKGGVYLHGDWNIVT